MTKDVISGSPLFRRCRFHTMDLRPPRLKLCSTSLGSVSDAQQLGAQPPPLHTPRMG